MTWWNLNHWDLTLLDFIILISLQKKRVLFERFPKTMETFVSGEKFWIFFQLNCPKIGNFSVHSLENTPVVSNEFYRHRKFKVVTASCRGIKSIFGFPWICRLRWLCHDFKAPFIMMMLRKANLDLILRKLKIQQLINTEKQHISFHNDIYRER